MNIEDIQKLWGADAAIDRLELGHASLDLPIFHHRYYKILTQERLRWRKHELELKELKRNRSDWYMGVLAKEDLDMLGWEPNLQRIIKADLKDRVESDKLVIEKTSLLILAKEKVDFLDSIIHNINIRGFQIKNAIEWEKFKVGG